VGRKLRLRDHSVGNTSSHIEKCSARQRHPFAVSLDSTCQNNRWRFGLVYMPYGTVDIGMAHVWKTGVSLTFAVLHTSIFHRLHTFSLRPRACMYHVATLVRPRKRYSVWHSVFFFPLTLHSIFCVDSCFQENLYNF
jgi:hypothetical protein